MTTTVNAEFGEVFFYQVDGSAEDLAFKLVRNSRREGWRVCVRGTSSEQLERFETRLWSQPHTEFFGLGIEGGEFDSDQSVLLTTSECRTNDRQALIVLPGATVKSDDVKRHVRVMLVFSGNDSEIGNAREHWKAFAALKCRLKYVKKQQGKWQIAHTVN
ncbi:MAG: DNA polymerase III subunit chi [Rhodobacteraceae bacterium]|nr:DNA polymerase III subunit chi [Paracoccaceae bacterium]